MTFTAEVANYLGSGNLRTDYSDGSWSRNVIEFRLSKYKVRLIQDTEISTRRAKAKGLIYTTDFEITGVTKFVEGERIVNDLCRILSLASFSQVVPLGYFFGGSGKRLNISAEAMYFRPLICITNGNDVQNYVEKIWVKYRKEKRTRKLGELIEMLTTAELPVQPLEIKLAQIFVVLENLKGTYARSKRIPFHKGKFRNVIYPSKSLKKQPSFSFEKLLTLMFSEVGMKPSLKKVTKLRNEIIHFGLSRKPLTSLLSDYEYCHDIVREYLLRFLGYEGKYLLYSAASRETKKIGGGA